MNRGKKQINKRDIGKREKGISFSLFHATKQRAGVVHVQRGRLPDQKDGGRGNDGILAGRGPDRLAEERG